MLFQDTVLHDQLECYSPAGPRMIQLIQSMIECGDRACSNGQPLAFPARIIDDPQRGFAKVESGFDLAKLFPNNRAFAEQNVQKLTIELNLAIARLKELPDELAASSARISKSSAQIRRLLERNRTLQARYEQIRAVVERLRARRVTRPQNMANRCKPVTGQSESVSTQKDRQVESTIVERRHLEGGPPSPTKPMPGEIE